MKILFFTDTHLRGTNPKNRKDDFVTALENKLNEIIDIIDSEDIDYIIHGGDLIDRPDVSISVVSHFSKILKKIKIPFYIVTGNHDIYGHNPMTMNRTVLGLLNDLDFLKIIGSNDKLIFEKEGIRVQVTGQPYIYDIDDINHRDYYILKEKPKDVNYAIHIVHGMLLDRPFIKGIPYTLIDEIKDTKADVTLSGHYHSGFNTIQIEDKYFLNPGSLVRVTNSIKEMDRRPQVVKLQLDSKIGIEYIKLKSALDGELVLDRKEIEKFIFKNERLSEFKQSIDSAMDIEKMDINDLLIEVTTSEGFSSEVKNEALRRIAEIQIKDNSGDY